VVRQNALCAVPAKEVVRHLPCLPYTRRRPWPTGVLNWSYHVKTRHIWKITADTVFPLIEAGSNRSLRLLLEQPGSPMNKTLFKTPRFLISLLQSEIPGRPYSPGLPNGLKGLQPRAPKAEGPPKPIQKISPRRREEMCFQVGDHLSCWHRRVFR